MNKIEAMLPYPISANRYWRTFRNRVTVSKEAKEYQRLVSAKLAGVEMIVGQVSVAIVLHPKLTKRGEASKTRIDLDNALKVTIDALRYVAYADDKEVVAISARIGEAIADGGVSVKVEEA